ncbi:MAG: PaaI family thioesterase [Gammaproteobacteria bacterium TMED182]|nr:thioesterase [Gammaproteobacteria bacterium]RPG56586.1 MAG: PaaI family thioesterase [Gammaproteobacteria bacterium TMED182]
MFSTALKELPPFGEAVGMVLEENDPGPGISVLLPGHPRLANDESDQFFHTGAILAIIDNTAGWCIRDHPDYVEGTSMATLDLRVDFLRRISLTQTLRVRAECEAINDNVAFVRATAEDAESGLVVAAGLATFMLGTPSGLEPKIGPV